MTNLIFSKTLLFMVFIAATRISSANESELVFYVPAFSHHKQIEPKLAQKITTYVKDIVYELSNDCPMMGVLDMKILDPIEITTIDIDRLVENYNPKDRGMPVSLSVPKKANVFVLGFIDYDQDENSTRIEVYMHYKKTGQTQRSVLVSEHSTGKLNVVRKLRHDLLRPIRNELFGPDWLRKLLGNDGRINGKINPILICDIDVAPPVVGDPPREVEIAESIPIEFYLAGSSEKKEYMLFLHDKVNGGYKSLLSLPRKDSVTYVSVPDDPRFLYNNQVHFVIASISFEDFERLTKKFKISYWREENLRSLTILQSTIFSLQ